MTAVAYRSGWCGSGYHDRCRGQYAGITCCCPHHDGPLLVTVRCFFGCPHVAQDETPETAHAAMEAHYFEAHREQIRAAVGWAAA